MASFIDGPNTNIDGPSVPVPSENISETSVPMDAAPVDEPQPEQLKRIFKYNNSNGNGMVIFNTEGETLDYFQNLYQLHSLIDEKHDQLAGNRGDDLKSKDMVYKNNLIKAINYSTLGNKNSFSTGVTAQTLKIYDINSGIHTLQDALERLGDSFIIQIESNSPIFVAPPLPSLQILPWICPKTPPDNFENNMVVYKNFNTDECDNEAAGNLVKDEIRVQSTGYVLDVGSIDFNKRITATGPTNGKQRNIVSGKLDSSTTGGPLTLSENPQNIEKLQTLIPFINIYRNGDNVLIGVIMIYVAPHNINRDGSYEVFVAFKFIPIANGNYTNIYNDVNISPLLSRNRSDNIANLEPRNGWLSYTIADQVPNLPDISEYMAGARGCFSAILKKIFSTGDPLVNKCAPYKDIAIGLWSSIGNTTIFQNDQDLFIMAFLMKIKWLGDLFRLIDSFMLTDAYNMPTSTSTVDTFMKRFACLSNLYVYCANKRGDLTINDVKTLTLEQMAELRAQRAAQQNRIQQEEAEIELQKRINKIDRFRTKIQWYKSLISQLDEFKNVNWIPSSVNVILNGILDPAKIKTGEIRVSRRLISIMVGCLTNQSYIYDGVTFTHIEMKSILDYFLTLFYYHTAFDLIFNTLDTSTTITSLPDIPLDIDVAGISDAYIANIETIFNDIDERMNILEKYNNIRKFNPRYNNTSHRVLFDDSAYLLSKNIAEMSTVSQFFFKNAQYDQLTKLPELNYEPNVGTTIRTHFGTIISRLFGQMGGVDPDPDRFKKLYKKGVDPDEAKKRRENELKNLRKEKKDDQLAKRRQQPVNPYYNYITEINSSREELISCLYKLNECLFRNVEEVKEEVKALSKRTNELSKIETNLRFKILYNLFYDNNNADNIPKDYDTIFNFFISVNFNDVYNAALKEIANEINNYNRIDTVVQNYYSYDKYIDDYRNLKQDVDEINSIYTNIFNDDNIEKLINSYADNIEREFTTEPIFKILPEPPLFDLRDFTNAKPQQQQQQTSVFNWGPTAIPVKNAGGGNSIKNRRTKKKTSKKNKKNTRKNRRTKRKPSK